MNMHQLSEDQNRALAAVAAGENIFLTGPAGTGKSTVLKKLQETYPQMAVTGTTGMAAVNVGGITIHSWAGLGTLSGSVERICRNIASKNKAAGLRIRRTDILAIDEISMLDAQGLDTLNGVLQAIRKCDRPFGGIQMILFGDFCQMPPVCRTGRPKLAFEAACWKEIRTITLTHIFRQENSEFAEALNDLRKGRYSTRAGKLLGARAQAKDEDKENHPPVILHSHNEPVDELNQRRLDALPGETQTYTAVDNGPEHTRKALDKYATAPTELKVKIGARVMLVKNLDQGEGLVNGSTGVVTGFTKPNNAKEGFPIVRFDNGVTRTMGREKWEIRSGEELLGTRQQVPLRLAWAITIHKIQGATLEKAELHLEHVFEHGQAYVALSRVKTPEGLFIASGNRFCIRADPKAVAFHERE